MYYHTTKTGVKIKLSDLSDEHLINISKLLKQKAFNGFLVEDGGGFDAEDIWYDSYWIRGEDALDFLQFDKYERELKKRHLLEYV